MDNLYIFLSISVLCNLFIFYLCVATKLCNHGIGGGVRSISGNERGMVERGDWLH